MGSKGLFEEQQFDHSVGRDDIDELMHLSDVVQYRLHGMLGLDVERSDDFGVVCPDVQLTLECFLALELLTQCPSRLTSQIEDELLSKARQEHPAAPEVLHVAYKVWHAELVRQKDHVFVLFPMFMPNG